MALPNHLYSNLATVVPKVVERNRSKKAAVQEERDAESRIRRKVEQAHRVLNKLEAHEKALSAQIKALQSRKSAVCARAERIEDRVLEEMMSAGMNRVTGIRTTFTTRLAPAALVIEDQSKIPDEYIRETVMSQPMKIEIKSALTRGVEIEGVSLTQKVRLVRQ